MRTHRPIVMALALLMTISALGPGTFGSSAIAQSTTAPTGASTAQPGRLIVLLKDSVSEAGSFSTAADYAERPGVTVTNQYSALVSGFAGTFDQAAITALKSDPNVAAVLPDRVFYPAAQENPTGPFRVGANNNPTRVGNGSGVVDVDVAVFDTGVFKHSDLNVVGGKDCTGGGNPYNDEYGHGTAVAGIIGAKDNSFGSVGVAPGARIWALKVASFDGLAYASIVMCAQEWMASHTFIKIVNFSFAGPDGGYVETCSSGLTRQGFCDLSAMGITTFVAAGNEGANASTWAPAQWPEVITVSAYKDYDGKPGALAGDGDDEMASFSNYGPVIDLSGPGVHVYTTAASGGYEYFDGTSGASPAAAAAGALLVAQQGISGQSAILNRLLISSEPGNIVGDPDRFHEPLINVSQLGAGRMTAKSSTYIGDPVRVSVSEFMAGSRITFRYDGAYVGGATAGADGKASLEFKVPASKKGTHTITASNTRKTVTKTITVKPKLWASPATTTVGTTIKATMKGYGANEVIKVTFDGRVMGSVTASASGTAVLSFTVPATRSGNKSVRGVGSQSSAYSATVVIKPTLTLLNPPVGGTTPAKLSLRGFARYETVTFHLDSASGTILGTATTSATGSASATVPLTGVPAGAHLIYAVGSLGSSISVSLGITSAEDPVITITPTIATTATPTATVVSENTVTAISTETATTIPTETALPTETNTVVAIETATTVPTETSVPTALPTETETVTPAETPTP